jgi:hypothetical protein
MAVGLVHGLDVFVDVFIQYIIVSGMAKVCIVDHEVEKQYEFPCLRHLISLMGLYLWNILVVGKLIVNWVHDDKNI